MRVLFLAALLIATSTLVLADNKGTKQDTWADSPTTTNLWQVISDGNLDELQKILEANPEYSTVRASDGRGPLWWAYEYGKTDMADALIKAGASNEERDADGKTPKEITSVGKTQFQQQQDAEFEKQQQQQQQQQIPAGGDDDDDDY